MTRPGKPTGLVERAETLEKKAQRAGRDDALRPLRPLQASPPAQLKEHKVAQGVWRRLMRLYGELEAEIVTRMDTDLLCDYCMLVEQVAELDALRRSAFRVWETAETALDEFRGAPEERYAMALKVQQALKDVISFDGRADRKRDLALKLRQSLYMTPRARAGTIPAQKPPKEPVDPLDELLDDVSTYVNNGGDGDGR